MHADNTQKAAAQFGSGIPVISPLGNGLIHRTSKVVYHDDQPAIVLQCINQRTFPQPENIIQNYLTVYHHLEKAAEEIKIPPLAQTRDHAYFWIDADDNFWRATRFVDGSYTITAPANKNDAYEAARCFAAFTRSLATLDTDSLYIILPGFHDLQHRYNQLEAAISKAGIMRLLRATHLISGLRQRKGLVDLYRQFQHQSDYPARAMHHDCKISNILFSQATLTALCPVDLDTVMPGKFFSDLGDMVRSMVCPEDEDSTAWENIVVRKEYYHAVVTGYLDGTGDLLTEKEKAGLHAAGLLMTCMQTIRYLTDYLNNDVYYQTAYPEQNLNRAFNQFILLEQLESFLKEEYNFQHP